MIRAFVYCIVMAGLLLCRVAGAQSQLAGEIRIWGHGSLKENYLAALLETWRKEFRQRHPGIRISANLRGDDTAIGGLYTGQAEVALMERAPIAIELDAYQPIFKTDPFEVRIATGSLDVPDRANPLAILVHRDNPLSRLTLAQLDAIFGADHRRGAANVHLWGELGLKGEWARRAIHVYVPPIVSGDAQYFEKAVMGGSQKWTGSLREFKEVRQGKGGSAAAARTAAAVARDRYAIALSTTRYINGRDKVLALATGENDPAVAPSRETVAARRYPLVRTLSVFVNRVPGQALEPGLRAFLDYLLSDEGQAAIERDGGYYRLPPAEAQREREKLQ